VNPEAALQRRILLAIDAPDVWCSPNVVAHGFSVGLYKELCSGCRTKSARFRLSFGLGTGSADIIGCVGSRFLGLEIKTPTGVVSSEQVHWHEQLRRRGAQTFIVRSVDEAVEAVRLVRGT
jgi:hypothetical protein